MTEQTTPTANWGDLVPFYGGDWTETLPDVQVPYYVRGSEYGYFLHRRTAQGRGLVKTTKIPPRLGKLEDGFLFDGPEVPAKIYAQAVSFFRRIWFSRKTEAEVIITQNQTTKEYRLFVPTQQVSHGGVYSIYNPEHIAKDHLVVGTFHSHCDFSPAHSGTDEGDARDMDGLHGTIGFVDRDRPEMDLMYALNQTFFQFEPDKTDDGIETFSTVVDMTDLTAGTAPEWWDRYVLEGRVADSQRQQIAPYADDEAWERFMGRYRRPKPQVQTPQTQKPSEIQTHTWNDRGTSANEQWMQANGYHWDEEKKIWRWQSQNLRESEEFNRGRYSWGFDDDDQWMIGWKDEPQEKDYWEDSLGAPFVNAILNTNVFTDHDLDEAIRDWPASGNQEYWNKRMRAKLLRIQDFLAAQSAPKPVEGQTTVTEHLEAADQT